VKPSDGGHPGTSGWHFPPPTAPEAILETARAYLAAGLSVIPIAADGTKAPHWQRLPRVWDAGERRYKHTWRGYQVFPATEADLQAWLQPGGEFGLGVVAGVVSGGRPRARLEVLDFDTFECFEPWVRRVEQRRPGLLVRLPLVVTPRPV
jgi:hypothetical protein